MLYLSNPRPNTAPYVWSGSSLGEVTPFPFVASKPVRVYERGVIQATQKAGLHTSMLTLRPLVKEMRLPCQCHGPKLGDTVKSATLVRESSS